MDFDACVLIPDVRVFDCRGARATLESVLFECWSSAAKRVRCVVLVVGGLFTLAGPLSLVTEPARDVDCGESFAFLV